MTQKDDPEDIILWPDGGWCYRHELPQFSYRSDDYQVIYWGTPEHYDTSTQD